MDKEKCEKCNNKIATWIYMPNSRFYCSDCVPRGCGCMKYLAKDMLPETNARYRWIEKDVEWCYVDTDGRDYPCCEYEYNENGFDVDSGAIEYLNNFFNISDEELDITD